MTCPIVRSTDHERPTDSGPHPFSGLPVGLVGDRRQIPFALPAGPAFLRCAVVEGAVEEREGVRDREGGALDRDPDDVADPEAATPKALPQHGEIAKQRPEGGRRHRLGRAEREGCPPPGNRSRSP